MIAETLPFDADRAERDVLALGATRVTDVVEDNLFRVFRDPAGHTFCLVWGIPGDDTRPRNTD